MKPRMPLLKPFRGPLTASPAETILRFVPAPHYMIVIYSMSSIPGEKITIQYDDRVAHFIEYFILGGLLVFSAAGLRGGTGRLASAAILAFVAVHAVADELHQSFVPGRDASLRDIGFDLLGASTAVFLLRRFAAAEDER